MGKKKAPGEDGITNEAWKCIGAVLSRYLRAIYNGCLREKNFSEKVEETRLIPMVKPGKKEVMK